MIGVASTTASVGPSVLHFCFGASLGLAGISQYLIMLDMPFSLKPDYGICIIMPYVTKFFKICK